MGLLDSLFSSDQGGGGGYRGLFDYLRQQPGGLPSDQAQYDTPPQTNAQFPIFSARQPSPLDNAQWASGPNGVPSQANAQMMPQQPSPVLSAPPPVTQSGSAQQLGFGDRVGASLQSFANSRGPLPAIANGITSLLTGQRTDPAGVAQQQQQQVQNQTLQWLLQRDVPPATAQAAIGNPKVLESLIKQMEPKALISTGSGHLYDPNSKADIKTYEPEDEIPAGFSKDDTGNMKFIPGGPADPAYLQLAEAKKKDPNGVYTLGRGGELYKVGPEGNPIIVHKNESEPQPMEPAALEILARREIGGDFSGRKNLGRGAQGAADLKSITNKTADILTGEMGMTPTQASAHLLKKQQEYNAQGQGLNSEARTTGVREANLNLILKAADAAIPAALEASDKVDRTGWVPLNKIIQGGEVIASNPDLKKFGMANLQLAEHWARAMNPTGVMRESDRDKALEFLSTKDSKSTYKEAVGQLRTQIERERDAVRSTRGMATMPGAAPETTPPPGLSAPKAGNYIWMPGKGLVAKE